MGHFNLDAAFYFFFYIFPSGRGGNNTAACEYPNEFGCIIGNYSHKYSISSGQLHLISCLHEGHTNSSIFVRSLNINSQLPCGH